ncbi:hypothetical protein GOV08_03280 [Candidatus Woesearchaeota archaeon]|nr:hypothetical protein [Candidatus Woesearchaeota archaeon]
MGLFGLVRDKCFYCREPIEKGKEHAADVKVPGYVGTFNKKFCSEEHAETYNDDIQNRPVRSGGGSC